MRLISGKHKNRRIEIPKRFQHIRPTSERTREAVFNLLLHGDYPALEGARVLDCCCGSGAMGFEALSRGAGLAMFLDSSADSLALVRQVAEQLKETAHVRTLQADATELPQAAQAFDVCFLDPPYGKYIPAKALKSLAAQSWLAEGAIVVVECGEEERLKLPEAYTLLDERSYGRAKVMMLRHR